MQLRMRLFKQRKTPNRGTLTCNKCGDRHLFALYDGGVCKSCYVPGAALFVPRKPAKEIKEQSLGTLLLRERVAALMDEYGLAREAFARQIGLTPQRMYLWWTGRLGPGGQRTINHIVDAGIAKHFVPRKPAKEIKEQSLATLLLRERVAALMDEYGLAREAFARQIGLTPQRMYLWWTGRLGPGGQRTINHIVDAGIAKHFAEVAA